MKNLIILFLVFGCLALTGRMQQPIPSTEITNGIVHAQIYLPDSLNGYYRGVRFDWSGVISSLVYNSHSYHGKWFAKYSPQNHDAIMGPVEEFGPVGYDSTAIGESFVKIGVGRLSKPDNRSYSPYRSYQIADGGKWRINKKKDAVAFTHILSRGSYAYVYTKILTLPDNKAQLVISHTLTNTGKLPIETSVYDHNFFVIDSQATGPAYQVTFPLDSFNTAGNKGLNQVVGIQGQQLSFLRELNPGEQGYFPDLTAGKSMPYKITVENVKTGAGVRISGDRPVSKLVFWSSPTTVCPEPYIDIRIAPGKSFSWIITYDYYITKSTH